LEKIQKAKLLLHLLCDLLLLHRACQEHSTIAQMVARQVDSKWRQHTMLIHDTFVQQTMHESARMLMIWENHKATLWSETVLITSSVATNMIG